MPSNPNSVAVVTSFSLAGWHKYGSRFVATFNEFWPKEVDLHLVSEDEFHVEQDGGRNIKVWNLYDSNVASPFLIKYQDEAWAHGNSKTQLPPGVRGWANRNGYCFRHDAYKFSKKVFAIELVARKIRAKKLFWIDADVVTFAPVPETFFSLALPAEYALSYLGRTDYHSECGFIGYDLRNAVALRFIRGFAKLYSSGEVFKLEEWHDSWVFDWLRKETAIPAFSIPHGSNHHPFINSMLGKYMDHLKGNRKVRGKSHWAEQHKHSSEPYWSGRR